MTTPNTSFANKLRQYFTIHEVQRNILEGGLGGGLATALIMPIDTISDVQKQWRNTRNDPKLNEISHSFLATGKEILRPKIRENAEGGIRPFYAGAGGKFLKVIPSMGIAFGVKGAIGKHLVNSGDTVLSQLKKVKI